MSLSLEERAQLIQSAIEAQKQAYAPYSRYQVGAAILTEDRRIFAGSNVENAVYPLGLCAERTAIATAISNGARRVLGLAVVTVNGGTPCGACRQVLREFATTDTPILVARLDGTYREFRLEELLPESFSVADLHAERKR